MPYYVSLSSVNSNNMSGLTSLSLELIMKSKSYLEKFLPIIDFPFRINCKIFANMYIKLRILKYRGVYNALEL